MRKRSRRSFNILHLLHDVFIKLDREFLRRQQTYHLEAAASLPDLHGDAAELRLVLTELLNFIIDRAPSGEDISIRIAETSLHHVSGMEVVVTAKDMHLRGVDRSVFFQRLYGKTTTDGDDAVVLQCRKRITARGGQLSCTIGKHHTLVYRFFLPVGGGSVIAIQRRQMFRYDIAIRYFMRLRKNFGIKACANLMDRIEATIISLVRQPLDVVVNHAEGKLAILYEVGSGGAESVASRISRRLAAEHFRVGKKGTPVEFEYVLTLMSNGARLKKRSRC